MPPDLLSTHAPDPLSPPPDLGRTLALGRWMQRLPNRHRLAALILGHVILAFDAPAMQRLGGS